MAQGDNVVLISLIAYEVQALKKKIDDRVGHSAWRSTYSPTLTWVIKRTEE